MYLKQAKSLKSRKLVHHFDKLSILGGYMLSDHKTGGGGAFLMFFGPIFDVISHWWINYDPLKIRVS